MGERTTTTTTTDVSILTDEPAVSNKLLLDIFILLLEDVFDEFPLLVPCYVYTHIVLRVFEPTDYQ